MASRWCTEYRGIRVQYTVTSIGSTQTASPENMDMPLLELDEYQEGLSTKYGTHERHTGGTAGPTVDFTRDMVMKYTKEDLLSNKDNS